MTDVFISYSRSIGAQAQRIETALRALGYDTWRDDQLPAHKAYTDVTQEHLRAAKAVLVIWTAEAVKSQWVRAEAEVGRLAGTLVQMSLDGAAPPLPFNQIQCADLNGWKGDKRAPGWSKVVASVADLVGGASTAASATVAAAKPAEPVLAVLPFDNLSGDADMAYFSDGVSEEILQTVVHGADMKVIGRGSSFQFRGADKGARHVGAALNATHVLDGSVRRSGDRVRIATHLVECADETTIWTERFDRELSDVFALQDEIAAAVAAALKVAFAPAVKAETVDPAAYNLYLKARDIRNRGLLSPSTVGEVVKLLQEATSLAPRFARAWEFLAGMQVERLRFDDGRAPRTVKRADVVAAAETALKLDPGLGGAYQALGTLEPFGRFAEREALHIKALAVAPNDPTVLTNASLFFAEVGRMRDALEYASQAYALDPMYPWAANWYTVPLEFLGRAEECRGLWASFRDRWPENELIAWGAVCAAIDFRDWTWFDEIAGAAREKGFDSPTLRAALAWGATVREPTAEVVASEVKRMRDRLAAAGVLPIMEFAKLARLGRTDEAFELIDQASFAYMFDPEMGSPNGAEGASLMFNANHIEVALMHDVRFVRLCAKLGLCDYWVKTGRWPDCADLVDYDFRAEARRLAG